MFDLDQQIDRWKSAFAREAACSSDELRELESHLREQIEALVAAGRSEQDAFCESAALLGDPTTIGGEFAKNDRIPNSPDSAGVLGHKGPSIAQRPEHSAELSERPEDERQQDGHE